MKKLQLLFTYSKDYFFLASIITFLAFYILTEIGIKSLTAIIWFKFIVSFIGILVHRNRKRQEIFFYMNNGIGERQLMLRSLLIDFLFFIAGIIIIVNFLK